MSDNEDSNEDIKPTLSPIWPCTGKPSIHPRESTTFSAKAHYAVEGRISVVMKFLVGPEYHFAHISTKDPLYKSVFMPFVQREGIPYDVSESQN
jgi:hypothetical protein